MLLIVNQLCPAVAAQACAVHETASRVVALHHAVIVFKQQSLEFIHVPPRAVANSHDFLDASVASKTTGPGSRKWIDL